MKELNLEAIKEKIGFRPNDWQAQVLSELRRFTKIVGGKRSGKSFLSSYLGFRELLASGRTIWVVAPTYELATRVWDNIEPWARKYPRLLKIRKMDPVMGRSIENIFQQSVLRIKSADNPKQLKGDAGELLIVEEAGDMEEGIWAKYLEPFVSEKRPALGGETGRAVFIGNAAHKGHWFHRAWTEPKDEQNISFHIPTAIEDKDGNVIASNNPNVIGVEELRRIKARNSTRIWRQEWLAEWLSGSGEVFRGMQSCLADSLKAPQPNHFYALGLDLAKHQDWTVLTVLDMNTFEVVHIDRFNQIDWNLQKLRILETARRYNNAITWMDATGIGDPIFDDLQRLNLDVRPYKLNNASKKALIEKLSIYIEQAKIKFPDDPQLLKELELFTYKLTESGNTTYSAPEGEHDDMVISLALAVWDLPESHALLPESNFLQIEQEYFESDTY